MRYFKKFSGGANNLDLDLGGARVTFKSVDGGVNGYLAVTDDNLTNALVQMIQEGAGGVTEVPCDEFKAEYIEKKNQAAPLRSFSREQLSARGVIGQAIQ